MLSVNQAIMRDDTHTHRALSPELLELQFWGRFGRPMGDYWLTL